jgi:hypothetical protein
MWDTEVGWAEYNALTLALSRFAGEGTRPVWLLNRVPSTTKWGSVRVRARGSELADLR